MTFIVNGQTYNSKKAYFLEMNPDKTDATQNDIDRYLYHNVKEYHDSKRTYYREKYRTQKNNVVRGYIKYNIINDDKKNIEKISNEEFQKTFFPLV